MTYDYHGHWDKQTGHVAPLYLHSESDTVYYNANYTINYYIRLGADPKKLIMGIPLYGQSFTLTDRKNNGLNAPTTGPGTAGQFTRQGGFLAYYEVYIFTYLSLFKIRKLNSCKEVLIENKINGNKTGLIVSIQYNHW